MTTYLHPLDGFFANVASQQHWATDVAGQLSDLQRKSPRQKQRRGSDGLPGADGDAGVGGPVAWGRPVLGEAGRIDRGAIGVTAGAKRGDPPPSPQANRAAITGPGLPIERLGPMPVAQEVAL